MAYTFDGPNKLIILSSGTTSFSVVDLYARWKDWMLLSDNSKYLEAISGIGGDPLPGGNFLGQTFFLENDWKIRPQEANHVLVVTGNLYDRAGGSPFVNTTGAYNVRIESRVSNIVDLIATGGSTIDPDDVADAVLTKADSIFPGWHLARSVRYMLSEAMGDVSGAVDTGTSNLQLFDPQNNLIATADVDQLGNRQITSYVQS
jgi:hypothetical protein